VSGNAVVIGEYRDNSLNAYDGSAYVYAVNPPAKVASITINDGDAQRSMVRSLHVAFDSRVTFAGAAAQAFSLVNQSTGAPVSLAETVDDTGAGTLVNLTFTGGSVDASGSLSDGRYTLKVLASQFDGNGFDGDGNGWPGDNFVEIGAPGQGHNLFRFFGDL